MTKRTAVNQRNSVSKVSKMRAPEPPPQYRARRIQECRLLPEWALGSLEEAAAFLAERGLLTRMPDSALPSLFGAVHEEPARPTGRGFDLWPRTRWIWSFQLAALPGVLLTKLHRGKSLYLSSATARSFDPLVRREMATATGDEARLLDHLSRQGASMAEDLELELGWDRARLKLVRTRLERVGAVVCDGLVFDDAATWHFAPMRRWDDVVETTSEPDDPLAMPLLSGLRAAFVAPEREVRSWFSWPIPVETVDSLVESGRLVRPAPGWVAIAS
jgi:hypothetical protein